MFPIYISRPGKSVPISNAPTYYIIAKNGILLHKKNWWVEATVPVKQISILDEQPIGVKLLLPSVSQVVLAKTVRFFRHIYKLLHTEAVVLLHYNKEFNQWELSVPRQTVSYARIEEYNSGERLKGFLCVGTIHSHARMGAFHSFTDRHDEAQWDGLHITIGDLHEEPKFSFDAEAVVNDYRLPLGLDYFEGIEEVKEEEDAPKSPFMRSFTSLLYPYKKLYKISDPEELRDWEIPQEWLDSVERKKYIFTPFMPFQNSSTTSLLIPDAPIPDTPEFSSVVVEDMERGK